jgi:hypothetical protein
MLQTLKPNCDIGKGRKIKIAFVGSSPELDFRERNNAESP